MMQSDDAAGRFTGRRVLVVEDEATIAMLLEDMLADLGCEVVGPAGRVSAALDLVGDAAIDLAILDVNLAGEQSFPVADALGAIGVPVIFSTGYGGDSLPDPYRRSLTLQKPFSQADLERQIGASLG